MIVQSEKKEDWKIWKWRGFDRLFILFAKKRRESMCT